MLNEIKEKLLKIKDIHWRYQDSTVDSVLFFKVTSASEKYIEDLKKSSYQLVVVNKKVDGLLNSVVVHEDEWNELQKYILDDLYPIPDMKMIGITGTNGKTTTTDLVLQLAHQVGIKGMSIGTLGVRFYNEDVEDFGLTSPSFIDLRKYLFKYGKDKDFCVMEVSSHSLVQDRAYGIEFDAAGWTSFSQDHLDFHESMDEYFKAKLLIYKKLKKNAKLFVPQDQKDLYTQISKTNELYYAKELNQDLPLFFSTKFNKNNLEVALSIVESIYPQKNVFDFFKITPPDGRFYIRPFGTNYIVVDFAHTPDALENICSGIKKSFPKHTLKVLFGCGGNRDRKKRPLMASVVDQYAEVIYVTSDNPRFEDPEQIIDDVVLGIKKHSYKRITNRPEAVKMAFSELQENEILLLAGKGHENYILINGIKHPYSDIESVDSFLDKVKK